MAVRLKPLSEQVIVITGASSGIGLTTAKLAAKRGARVVLVSRNEQALNEAVQQIQQEGGRATSIVADVAKVEDLRRAAEHAQLHFGHIDTWINNAGVSIYGRIEESSLEDDKRLFETNFWGVVNGSRIALEYLRNGGAIINVGSIVSDRALPLQGIYSASKHAVQGFTDALRMEVEEAGLPISVTLIKPAAINTPFAQHAKNNMAKEPDFPPPVYAPEVPANQILHAACHPVRELYAGGGGRMLAGMGRQMPRWMDHLMELLMFRQQQSDRPATHEFESLHQTSGMHTQYGKADQDHMVRSTSLYSTVSRHPLAALAAVGVVAVVGAYLLKSSPPQRSALARASRDVLNYASKAVNGARSAIGRN